MNDVICSASDIRIACNKIEAYLDFLVRMMEEYMSTLSSVQKMGICDDLISARLSDMADQVKECAKTLNYFYQDYIKMSANREISEIRAADNFQYPHELLARISSILARFI